MLSSPYCAKNYASIIDSGVAKNQILVKSKEMFHCRNILYTLHAVKIKA